jgi:hypothetical protein
MLIYEGNFSKIGLAESEAMSNLIFLPLPKCIFILL